MNVRQKFQNKTIMLYLQFNSNMSEMCSLVQFNKTSLNVVLFYELLKQNKTKLLKSQINTCNITLQINFHTFYLSFI